jgi:hypothetical protein
MTLSDNLNQAAQYTGSIFQRIGDLLILFIVSIIPIVNFISLGYYARIVRDSPSSKNVPKLERYMDMFIEGLKIIVVVIIWAFIIAIIAVIIAIPLIAAAFLTNFTNLNNFLSVGWIFAFGSFFVIFGIIAFFVGIIAFMGIINMVKKNSFGKAFAFGEIIGMIGKIGWLRYLAFFVVTFIALAIVGIINGALGPIGWVVGAVLSVLLGLFISRTIGLMYDNAAGVNMQTPPVSAAPPAVT